MIKEISKEEACAFLKVLEKERKTFRLTEDEVASSHIIVGERIGGEIVGIGGVRRQYRLPLSWIAVRKGRHNEGVGTRLLFRVNALAAKRHSFLLATILEWNVGAQRITQRCDYRTYGKWDHYCYLIHPIDNLGQLLWRLLSRFFGFLLRIRKGLA